MKLKLVFVDDERDVLKGLQRSLRPKRHDWDMRFAFSAADAICMFEDDPAHMIITDMRMPDIDGAMLLEEVAERWPFTCRFVLSGQADSSVVRRTIGISHQFLAKPYSSADMITLLDDHARMFMAEGVAEQCSRILAILSLPSPQKTVDQLDQLLDKRHLNKNRIATVIGDDLALSAKMLQLSNSAYFGSGHITITPGAAVRTLGIDLLHSLVSEPGFVDPFDDDGNMSTEVISVLELSTRFAQLADRIADAFGSDLPNPALLRQLMKFLPLGRLLGLVTGAKPEFDAQLCCALASLWGFPAPLQAALREFWFGPRTSPEVLAAGASLVLAHNILADFPDELIEFPLFGQPEGSPWLARMQAVPSPVENVA